MAWSYRKNTYNQGFSMKTRILVAFAVAFLVFCFIGVISLPAAAPTFKVSDWQLIRAVGNEDGATSAACLAVETAGDFANMPSTAFQISAGGASDTTDVRCVIAICGGADSNLADDTGSFVVYGWAEGGPAEFICEGDFVLGTQQVVKYPNTTTAATDINWADTINVDSTTVWIKGVLVTDSGNNRIAHLSFDTTGLKYIGIFFYDAAGVAGAAQPNESNNTSAYARFY
jgi:hypothetical protein